MTVKTLYVTAHLLNDKLVPFFDSHEIKIMNILTDRGTQYCGKREHHEYQLYLTVEDIGHNKTKARSPQTNGICERFHRTIQEEFYATAFRKKVYLTVEELQEDLDRWLDEYNLNRTHQGKYCFGKTPMRTLLDSKHLAKVKMIPEKIGYFFWEEKQLQRFLNLKWQTNKSTSFKNTTPEGWRFFKLLLDEQT